MTDDVQLSAGAELAIRKYVSSYLFGIAAFIGIANLVVLVGALYFVVGETARQAVDREVSALGVRQQVSETLMALGGANSEISAAQNEIEALRDQATFLGENVSTIVGQNGDVIGDVARIVEVALENPGFAELAVSTEVQIETAGGVGLRAFLGETCAAENPWQACPEGACGSLESRAGIVDISMSEADFEETPMVFVSQSGGGSWTTSGLSAIYDIQPDSFRLYAYSEYIGDRTYFQLANQANHCVHWLAIGR